MEIRREREIELDKGRERNRDSRKRIETKEERKTE